MKKAIKAGGNIIRNSKAFTLAEALVTVLILLLVSGIVAAGIPAAFNAYEKIVGASEAEILMSTTMTSLRNELGTAKDIAVNGTTIAYYSEAMESIARISTDNKDIKYQCYPEGAVTMSSEALGNNVKFRENGRLVSDVTDASRMHVTYSGVTYNGDGVITIKDLSVIRVKRDGSTVPVETKDFSILLFMEN